MKVVSNSSPLINLAWINHLNLLHDLFGNILIPPAVWDEVVIKGEGQPGCAEVQGANWITVTSPNSPELVQSFRQSLDQGEAEAIAIAVELKADLLVMDEKQGRETANFMGLKTIGLVGVLSLAKKQGRIERVKPLLDALRSNAGFYLSNAVYQQIINDLGE